MSTLESLPMLPFSIDTMVQAVMAVLPVVGFPLLGFALFVVAAIRIKREQRLLPSSLHDALVRGAREMRRRQLELKPLSNEKRTNFLARWTEIAKRLREEPPKAVDEAGVLLDQVFNELGYPAGDVLIRAEDLESDHVQAAVHYLRADAIATKSKRGTATIAELYAGFEAYGRVLSRLLQTPQPAYVKVRTP